MPGLVPGIHAFLRARSKRRGWPGQAHAVRFDFAGIEGAQVYTLDEAAARLQKHGLPVSPTPLQLTGVAHALNDLREDGETDDLDNRRFNDERGDSE